MHKYLEFSDGSSNKFWQVTQTGNTICITFGKIGTAGQTQEKSFPSEEAAAKEAEKQATAKIKKGYQPKAAPGGAERPKAKTVETAAASRPAATEKAKPPAAKKDDGKVQHWHGEDFWDSYFDEEVFANLANGKTPQAVQPSTPLQAAPAAVEEDDFDDDDDDDNGDLPSKYSFSHACEDGNIDKVQAIVDKVKAYDERAKEKKLPYYVNYALKEVFDHYEFELGQPEVIALLLENGAAFTQVKKMDKSDMLPIFRHLMKSYEKEPDGGKLAGWAEEYCLKTFPAIAANCITALEKVIKFIETGEPKDIRKDTSSIPRGKLPDEVYGFMLVAEGKRVYVKAVDAESTEYLCQSFETKEAYDYKAAAKYLPQFIKPLLADMAKNGKFDSIAGGSIKITLKYVQDALLEYVTDQAALDKRREALAQDLALLEKGEDWEENAKKLKYVAGALVEGAGLVKPDHSRALAIILKHLYSAHPDCEDTARSLLGHYEDFADDYAKWEYHRIIWHWDNLDFKWAWGRMDDLAKDHGYAPAREKCLEWGEHPVLAARKGKEGDEEESGGSLYGAARVKEFHKRFSESDLFIKTDNIIARATDDADIVIRFLVEGEAGYGEALDFMNRLMERGYSRLFDGFGLLVRFVDKPVFIKDLKMPKTFAHAFFAKAALYEGLHEKIEKHIELVLHEYDTDKEMQDEYCTVVGGFAALAMAFHDVKYIRHAGAYGRNSDGEHDSVQLSAISPLIKRYGVNPKTVPALFDLIVSFEQEYYRKFPQELYTVPENLAAVIEHCGKGYYSQRQTVWKICEYVEHVIKSEPKAALKALKSFAAGAPTREARNIYVDFYNFYKEAATANYKEDYGDDLSGEEEQAKEITIQQFDEQPACVITLEEAKKRGLDVDGTDAYSGRYGIVFTPVCEANPYVFDHVAEHWEAMCNLRDIATTISWGKSYMRFGNWLVDLAGAPLQYGVVLYDGKNKPAILYGVLNFAAILGRFYKRPYRSEAEREEARQKHTMLPCPEGSPFIGEGEEGVRLYDIVRGAMLNEKYYRAMVCLSKIEPGDRAYGPAQLYRAKLAQLKQDKQKERAIWEELLAKEPQYADYFREKLEKLRG